MDASLKDIAQKLKDSNKKVQLIYAFNSTGKTRLSQEFRWLVEPDDSSNESNDTDKMFEKILYYNAFTEDLFYWDNDIEHYSKPRLKIHPNAFTNWIFIDQGQDRNIISHFQHYTHNKLMPHFNEEYTFNNHTTGETLKVEAFTEIAFSYERGNEERLDNIKISKGEESLFIWCVFYSLLEQVIDILNVAESSDRESNQFDELKYVFIDDPVSSLDENNLIELAVDLAQLIKSSESELKFIVTTHNPLFYNVLFNEFKRTKKTNKYFLIKTEDGMYSLQEQRNDSPFSYHLLLKKEIDQAIETGQIKKYHFNFLRNFLEKTATFLGYTNWKELIPDDDGAREAYVRRINLYSHSSHSDYESYELPDNDKRVLTYLMKTIKETYHFK